MKKNLHSLDQFIRLLFTAAVAVLYFTDAISGILGIALGLIAIILAITAIIEFCPIYYVFGFSTKKSHKKYES